MGVNCWWFTAGVGVCGIARDNKNRYCIGYLAWLVGRGVFDYIEIGFLPVGHTHEASAVTSLFSSSLGILFCIFSRRHPL